MKNLFLFLFALLPVLGYSPLVQAQAPVVAIGSVAGCIGDTVDVPLNVTNFTNICAVSLEINFDSSAIRFVGFNNSSLTGNLIVNNPATGGIPQSRVLVS